MPPQRIDLKRLGLMGESDLHCEGQGTEGTFSNIVTKAGLVKRLSQKSAAFPSASQIKKR